MSMLETVEEKQDRLALLATEINTIKSQTQKIMMQASVEIGKRLAEAKGAVGHGNWEAWLQTNVDYSQRTASNLIKIYEEYGLGQQKLFGKEVNPQSLATLTYTQAVALLGIHDADERAEFVETHDVENMSSRELQRAIKERDDAKAELKAAAEVRDKRIEERDRAHEELAKAMEKINELKKQMAESKTDSPNDIAIHNLEVQLAVAKGKAKELEKKLETAQNDHPEPTVVEKVPDDVQNELDQLRAEIAAAKNQPVLDPEQQKIRASFAVHIEVFQQEYNRINEFVQQMGNDDRAKYELAFQRLIGIMMQKLTGGEE